MSNTFNLIPNLKIGHIVEVFGNDHQSGAFR